MILYSIVSGKVLLKAFFLFPLNEVLSELRGRFNFAIVSIVLFVNCNIDKKTVVQYGPSMMSQGKTPWKDPRGGVRGVFPGERCLEKTPQPPLNPLWGVFPRGLSPGHH